MACYRRPQPKPGQGTPVATGAASFFRFSGLARGGLSTTGEAPPGHCWNRAPDRGLTTFTNGVLREIENAAFGMPAADRAP